MDTSAAPAQTTSIFGQAVRLARVISGRSQEDVAFACGLTAGTVSSWETGTRTPTLQSYVAAMGYLDADRFVFEMLALELDPEGPAWHASISDDVALHVGRAVLRVIAAGVRS